MKTYKREVSMIMLAFLASLFLWGDQEAARFLTMPIFMFAGAAFGLDAYAKQIK